MDAPAPSGDVESSSSSSEAVATGNRPPHFLKVKYGLFTLNCGFMVFLAAVGALGMGSAESINDTGLIFVGLYLMIFAALVFLYELSQILNWERMDDFMKRNFGFLYGVYGKSLFILM